MAAPDLKRQREAPPPRARIRGIGDVFAGLLVWPIVLGYRAQAALMAGRRDEVFQGYTHLMGLCPGFFGNYLRRAFYRRTLRRCSGTCFIGFGTHFATPEVEIGEHVYIGPRCMIAHCTLHDDVLVGSGVDILAGRNQHYHDRLDTPIRLQGGEYRFVSIGPDAWIGNGAIIADDVGAQAIVAAGAVVVKPVAAQSIVGGNPARLLADRTATEVLAIASRQP